MCLSISSLNSGSNGNCYYIGNSQEAILVDVGISCREVEKRMYRLGLSMELVKAIFISHEHSDHIRGLSILSKKYQIPVYITAPTLLHGRIALQSGLVKSFTAGQQVQVGHLLVTAFTKCHDAVDPYSFIVSCQQTTVGVFTDIGKPCDQLIKNFALCNAAFLESNYDEVMLDKGGYPYHLKVRIRGGNGHLSNRQALEVFIKHRPKFMSHLVLSHLSKNNNCPDLVAGIFNQHANGVNIIVASRYRESEVYHINEPAVVKRNVRFKTSPAQLSFSFA